MARASATKVVAVSCSGSVWSWTERRKKGGRQCCRVWPSDVEQSWRSIECGRCVRRGAGQAVRVGVRQRQKQAQREQKVGKDSGGTGCSCSVWGAVAAEPGMEQSWNVFWAFLGAASCVLIAAQACSGV